VNRKVYIPFSRTQRIGGPASFMINLKAALDAKGYPYTGVPYGAKSIFFPVTTSERKIKRVRRWGGKVIQRLDGIDYRVIKEGERDPNATIRKIYNTYTDHVVFQSEFSKRQVFSILGEKDDGAYSIICNGANTDIFYPDTEHLRGDEMRFATSGNFRHPLMIWPIVEAMDALIEIGFQVRLDLIGPINLKKAGDREKILARPYIQQMQFTEQKLLADRLRQNDAFVYTHYNSACPNAVIEATSCGLPVVGYDSGAMNEVCYFSRDLLAPVSGELIHDRSTYDVTLLLRCFKQLVEHYDHYREQALAHSDKFSMAQCGQAYMELFERIKPDSLFAAFKVKA